MLNCTCGWRVASDDAFQCDLGAAGCHSVLKKPLKPRALSWLLISRHVGVIRWASWKWQSGLCGTLVYAVTWIHKWVRPQNESWASFFFEFYQYIWALWQEFIFHGGQHDGYIDCRKYVNIASTHSFLWGCFRVSGLVSVTGKRKHKFE